MITPLSWLERVPTYKGQLAAFAEKGKDIATYGFLGYPLLMAADILMYRPVGVPVGQDQLPHVEFCRELVRRFHHLYEVEIFPEPAPIFSQIAILPGTDNRKMSKSYNNYINLSDSPEVIKQKVWGMVTDPARIRKTDPGHPEVCAVYAYQGFYNKDKQAEICANCAKGCIGCGECARCCPAKAIQLENKLPVIDREKCIKCYCCQELCPRHAMKIGKPLVFRFVR